MTIRAGGYGVKRFWDTVAFGVTGLGHRRFFSANRLPCPGGAGFAPPRCSLHRDTRSVNVKCRVSRMHCRHHNILWFFSMAPLPVWFPALNKIPVGPLFLPFLRGVGAPRRMAAVALG